jgi:nitrate reductase delta subunit
MNRTLKALSALLAYPTADLREALPEVEAVLVREPRLRGAPVGALWTLIAELSAGEALDLEERYVALFDRGRRTSLHLFEHVHGESRARGPAMVDLKQLYRRAGYRLSGGELPDYLPALLEFLSLRPEAEAREILGDCAHLVREVGAALAERGSAYAGAFAALLAWAGEAGLEAHRAGPRSEEKSIDEEWIDAEVVFGPGAAPACGTEPAPRASVLRFVPRAR